MEPSGGSQGRGSDARALSVVQTENRRGPPHFRVPLTSPHAEWANEFPCDPGHARLWLLVGAHL